MTGSQSWTREYDYDAAGQLAQIIDAHTETTLASIQYDTHGRRTTHTTPAGTTNYSWDEIGQLAQVDHPNATFSAFTYDEAGRRDSRTRGNTHETYEYDPSGKLEQRITTYDEAPAWTETRSWDPNGGLASVEHTDHAEEATTTETLFWDPTSPVAQLRLWTHDSDASTTEFSLWQDLAGEPRGDGQNGPYAIDAYGSHYDLWSDEPDRSLAGATGYNPWGLSTDQAEQHTYLGYRGELHIGGLIHLRNRDYDPLTGTFTTPDPLDGVDGTTTVANPYHYADNNPLNKVDPLGLRPCDTTLECFLAEKEHPGGVGGATPVACTDEGFPPQLGASNRLEPLRYHCRVYEIADAPLGWTSKIFAQRPEPSTVHLGLVAVSATANGVSPEWRLMMQNHQYLPNRGFAPWVAQKAMTPASARVGIAGIIAAGAAWQAYETRSNRYREEARVVDAMLLATEPSFEWALMEPDHPWFAGDRTVLLVRKMAVSPDCRHWRQVAALGFAIVTEPMAGDWMRCSDVEI